MRTLSRKLMIPQVGEQPAGEESYSIRLPRRRTRRLFTALALVLGVGAGVAYSRYFLSDQPPLTTVAVAAVGAILGFVLVLMPGVALRFLRKLACRAALARRRAELHRLLERSRRRLNRLLEKDGEDAQAWNALGLVEQLRGDRRRAASCLEKAWVE